MNHIAVKLHISQHFEAFFRSAIETVSGAIELIASADFIKFILDEDNLFPA